RPGDQSGDGELRHGRKGARASRPHPTQKIAGGTPALLRGEKHMKTVFLGSFGARPGVWEAILAKTTEKLDVSVLFDLDDAQRLIPLLADAEIVVSHIWKKDFPAAPRVKLLQSVAAGLDLIDVPSLPAGVTVCNVSGHEQAIAEYVLMTMLAWQHRLIDIVAAFRGGVWSTG